MLTRLSIKNFRLLRDVSIDVEPGKPIVLIGPNSSGKSSVIHVLDLLERCAREGLKPALQAFGGGGALVTAARPSHPGHDASIAVSIDLTGAYRGGGRAGVAPRRHGRYLLDYELAISSYSSQLKGEQLRTTEGDGPPVEVMTRTSRKLSLKSKARSAIEERELTPQEGENISFELMRSVYGHLALDDLRQVLSNIKIYDGFLTTPLWSRDVREGLLSPFDSAVISPEPRIDRRGLSLVNALYYIQSSHPDEWDELERSFRAEFPFVQRLEFPPDPAGGRVALGWRDRRYPGVRMLGHQMSEGMTAYLCTLAAILSGDRNAVIAFDEPDRHLHPSALRRVVYLLEKLSERTAVFIATHSDRFLDYLSDPAGSLRVCEPTEEGASIRKLDRAVLDEWRKDYTMSQLREQGQLDVDNASLVEP